MILGAFFIGLVIGALVMAIISSGGQADERTQYYFMHDVLLKVLSWYRNKCQGAFPEKDVLDALGE